MWTWFTGGSTRCANKHTRLRPVHPLNHLSCPRACLRLAPSDNLQLRATYEHYPAFAAWRRLRCFARASPACATLPIFLLYPDAHLPDIWANLVSSPTLPSIQCQQTAATRTRGMDINKRTL